MHRTLPAALFVVGAVVLAANDHGSAAERPAVTHIRAAQVEAAFAKGAPLLEVAAYKIHASRRDKPGIAEIHTLDTDIIYVLDGSATFVTGGDVRGGATTAPGEIRGESIQGGETRLLAKGDVVVVPNGTPHWFKEVSVPLLYYVVKVTAARTAPPSAAVK